MMSFFLIDRFILSEIASNGYLDIPKGYRYRYKSCYCADMDVSMRFFSSCEYKNEYYDTMSIVIPNKGTKITFKLLFIISCENRLN
jgi:hypothetical protein